ncbi:MAG: histidine phosphatase family protein [DPANN group archaeon]|nr:histidine phosphatase family protein [DPANN group archaeon]
MVQTIFLLRHAESESNVQKYYGGWTDSPLTDLGRKQAGILGRRLLRENIGKAYCSDLARARQTFQAIGLQCPIEYAEALREKNYGIMEGKPWTDAEEHRQAHFNQEHKFEKGESVVEVQKRVVDFFNSKVLKSSEEKVIVVSHHNPLVALACHVIGLDLKNWRHLQIGNAGLCILNFEEGIWRIKLWNSLSHFGLQNDGPLY